jgi:hypothetical protein
MSPHTILTTVLPTALLRSDWYAVLTAFVALNTIMYVALAIGKVLPKLYLSDWVHSPDRRSQTRSIYPDGHGDVADAGVDPREVLLDPVG